jgi:futalosine hydrolase
MRILVVAATSREIAPLLAQLRQRSAAPARANTYTRADHDVDVLVTGVGMVSTAAKCSPSLSQQEYDLALNLGVCGSFDSALTPGTVVHVTSDCIPELGAEDDEKFLSIQELGLLGENEFPFKGGHLVNDTPPVNPILSRLPTVKGITVNTVHGNPRSIAAVVNRFTPQTESMEGAAFMYACLIHGVSFAQVRAVSNLVERRNRAAWDLTGAIRSVCETSISILDHA